MPGGGMGIDAKGNPIKKKKRVGGPPGKPQSLMDLGFAGGPGGPPGGPPGFRGGPPPPPMYGRAGPPPPGMRSGPPGGGHFPGAHPAEMYPSHQEKFGFFTNAAPSVAAKHINSKDEPMPRRPPGPPGGGAYPTPSPATAPGPPGHGPSSLGPPAPNGGTSNWVPMRSPQTPPRQAPKSASIHELFGKMVWKKMEQLRDQVVVDKLQNDIMELIAKAVKEQAAAEQKTNNDTRPMGTAAVMASQ